MTDPATDPPGVAVVIDVSHDNGAIDFAAARAGGVQAVIHKASEGTGFVDPRLATNVVAARAAGLLVGLYHFGTGDDPAAQAAHFLATARSVSAAALPLVLDLESNRTDSMNLDQARVFVAAVRDRTGKPPGLYSGAMVKAALGASSDPVLGGCWLWLAQYDAVPVVQASWATWSLWQYTDGTIGPAPHAIPGLPPLDRSRFNGAADQLEAFWAAVGAVP